MLLGRSEHANGRSSGSGFAPEVLEQQLFRQREAGIRQDNRLGFGGRRWLTPHETVIGAIPGKELRSRRDRNATSRATPIANVEWPVGILRMWADSVSH